ncbi:endonuclease I family protein [Glaciimonas sp. GG7]
MRLNTLLGLSVLVICVGAKAEVIADVYRTAEGLEGEALIHQLQEISANNHTPASYRNIWLLLQEADRDPANENNVLTLYSQQSIPKRCRVGAKAEACPQEWNREHVWAKSHGFPQQGQWAHTDGHHLRAATEYCNSLRGNLDFAEGGEVFDGCPSNKRTTDHPRTWEPSDAAKGQVARMMFYMAVRYKGDIVEKTPNLQLVDRTTEIRLPESGKLCTLLKWHEAYPVSAEEQRRNNIVEVFQGNRNPFIDKPEFAGKIWAGQCG